MEPVGWNEDLYQAAKFHTDDIGPKGLTGHSSSDGTQMGPRVKRFYTENVALGENISFGTQQAGYDPQAVLVAFIVDDGVASRGHRKSIFTAGWKFAGVSCGDHKNYKSMCTINLAG